MRIAKPDVMRENSIGLDQEGAALAGAVKAVETALAGDRVAKPDRR